MGSEGVEYLRLMGSRMVLDVKEPLMVGDKRSLMIYLEEHRRRCLQRSEKIKWVSVSN